MKLLQEMTEPELNEFFTKLARLVEAELPPGPSSKGKCLFMLVVVPTCEPGTAQYVGNMQRTGAIGTLRELCDRLETNTDKRRDDPRRN